MLPFSCCLSAAAICFLAVLFPPQVSASLTVRLSARCSRRTATGFPCSALLRCDRYRAPPILRDRGALMADIETSATTAASQRRVLFLRYCFHLPEFWLTKLAEVHSRSPFPVFPLPVTSGWNAGPWAFSRASHPAVTSSACQERERALSTRPELTADNFDPPFQLSHSRSATSCRTSMCQWLRTQAARVAGQASASLVIR